MAPERGAGAARVAGYLLLLAFFSLQASANGTLVTFRGALSSSSPGELNLWLGYVLLLCPAALLLGYGFSSRLAPLVARMTATVEAMSAQDRCRSLFLLALIVVAAARLGRAFFLLDLPITDDEYAVDFGGRILASGHAMATLALPRESVPALFLYFKGDAVGSFDWIGGQLVAALAHLTRLGPLVWGMLAATPVAALAALMGRRLGAAWGLAAAFIFLCSPMAALLSLTTHAHLASRAFLSLALLTLFDSDRIPTPGRSAAAGVCLGLAFICRPLEMAFFSAPLAIGIAWSAIHGSAAERRAFAALVGGFAPVAAILLLHAYAMTGNPLLPARFAAEGHTDVTGLSLWGRFGDNFTYNLLMLAVWFLGPFGLVLVAFGALTNRVTKLLGGCVVADLCLSFFHDNSGLHIVGPIHYSECAVPLTVIATYGLANLVNAAGSNGLARSRVAAAAAVSLGLALGTFTLVEASALRRQAAVQAAIYQAIERGAQDRATGKAVVLAPWMFAVVNAQPDLAEIGSWVHDWRRPQLDLDDDVLILRDLPSLEPAVRQRFADRRLFRLALYREPPFLALVPLDGGAPRPLDVTR